MRFLYQNAGASERDILDASRSLAGYGAHLREVVQKGGYDANEASVNLPDDRAALEAARSLAKEKNSGALKYVVVVGIGGSNLGTEAVYDASFGELDALSPRAPKILFMDTVSPRKARAILGALGAVEDAREVVVCVVSKSGGTTETVANFEWLYGELSSRLGDLSSRVVAITDEGSALWKGSKERGFSVLPIPKKVGGRYSVFSPVGLFPLSLAGIDLEEILSGARDMRDLCLKTEGDADLLLNPALVSAALSHRHFLGGKTISNHFVFATELESAGRWYRQLMGESIGKERDLKGEVVHAGITPVVSVGSTDLHSMAQLYIGGPEDKFTHFVYPRAEASGVVVPEKEALGGLVSGIAGKDFDDLMDAILSGVKAAYENRELPFVEVVLEKISAREVGAFLQFKMLEMMYLAQLLGLNAFDQPNVEEYKRETKRILER